MNTILEQAIGGRRRRRTHSDEFKADAVAACMQPGISMAAVAMSREINAKLLRRWVREAEAQPSTVAVNLSPASRPALPNPAFVPLPMPIAQFDRRPDDNAEFAGFAVLTNEALLKSGMPKS